MSELKKFSINLDDFNIKKIKIYDGDVGEVLLEFNKKNGSYIKTNKINGDEYLTEASIKSIFLNNEIKNAKKLNLKRKDNFIINKPKEYKWEEVERILFINAKLEGIKINFAYESNKEYIKGEKRLYNNYTIERLNFVTYELKHFYINEEEYKNLKYYQYHDWHIEKLEEAKNDYIKTCKKWNKIIDESIIKIYDEKIKDGFYARGFKYFLTSKNYLLIEEYIKTVESEARILYKKNSEFLRKNDINPSYEGSKTQKFFEALGLNLYKIDIEEYIKNGGLKNEGC